MACLAGAKRAIVCLKSAPQRIAVRIGERTGLVAHGDASGCAVPQIARDLVRKEEDAGALHVRQVPPAAGILHEERVGVHEQGGLKGRMQNGEAQAIITPVRAQPPSCGIPIGCPRHISGVDQPQRCERRVAQLLGVFSRHLLVDVKRDNWTFVFQASQPQDARVQLIRVGEGLMVALPPRDARDESNGSVDENSVEEASSLIGAEGRDARRLLSSGARR